jgi:hypothetical protein
VDGLYPFSQQNLAFFKRTGFFSSAICYPPSAACCHRILRLERYLIPMGVHHDGLALPHTS